MDVLSEWGATADRYEWMEPTLLLDGILREQKRLISGYGGSLVTDRDRFDEARNPAHVALSLMGEPTLYPMLDELIREIRKRSMTSFLVSNGSRPEVIGSVKPTQLYLSLNAPDETTYMRIANPCINMWPSILKSLEELKESESRTVVRITLIRGQNNFNIAGYAKLLEIAEPDFIEVKAYMHLGFSRKRLTRDAMPEHADVTSFAKEIADALGYTLADEVALSRVALLTKNETDSKRIL